MVNEQNDLKLPAALRMAANSSGTSGRKFILVNEEEGLQLPPALRIAANTGRGKKTKRDNERMTLKNDAKAMRRRLEQMEDQADMTSGGNNKRSIGTTSIRQTQEPKCVEGESDANTTLKDEVAAMRERLARMEDKAVDVSKVTKNISIDSTRGRPPPGPRNTEKKSGGSSVKYSNEVLNKKIKKVEKMLGKSAPRSKEFRALKKKLIEYHSQLKQQSQQDGTRIAIDYSSTISENECKESEEEQEQGTINSNAVKKRNSYGSKFKEQEGTDSVTDDRERENRMREYEEAEKAYQNAIRQQARLSLQRSLEKKQKEKSVNGSKKGVQKLMTGENQYEELRGVEKNAEDSSQEERVRVERRHSRPLKNDVNENVLSQEQEPSQHNFFTHYGEDKNARKKAFLEEARRLKQDALNIKNRGDKSEQTVTTNRDEIMMRNESSFTETSEKENDNSKNLKVNDVSKTAFVDNEGKNKKQAFIEEARRLKQQALAKRVEEEQLRERSKQKDQAEDENEMRFSPHRKSVNKDTKSENAEENFDSKYVFVDNDAERRKKAFLEEARRLKQDALEKKAKEEQLKEESKAKDQQQDKKSSPDLRIFANEEMKSNDSEDIEALNYVFVDRDREIKKQAYVKEARRLMQEAARKKSQVVESRKERNEENHDSDEVESVDEEWSESTESSKMVDYDQIKKQAYLDEARILKQEAMRKKLQLEEEYRKEQKQDDDESQEDQSIDETESTGYMDVGNEANEKDCTDDQDENCDFSNMIQSSEEKENKYEEHNGSTIFHEPIIQEKETNFSAASNAQHQSEDEIESESAQYTDYATHKKKPNFLEEIKSKAKVEDQKQQNDSILITEFALDPKSQSKPEAENRERKEQVHSPFSSDSTAIKTNATFLEEIKSIVEVKQHHNVVNSSIGPTTGARKSNFLQHIKPKEQGIRNTQDKKDDFLSSDSIIKVRKEVMKQGDDQNSFAKSTVDKTNFLNELKYKAKGGREDKHRNDSISPPDNKPNFLEEIETQRDAKEENAQNNSSTLSSRNKPNFLKEIKSKADRNNEAEHHNDSIGFAGKKPNFLQEIKSKADNKIQDTNQNVSGHSTRKKPNFLQEIKFKAGDEKKDKHQNIIDLPSHERPNFLEEIKSKRTGEGKNQNQNVSVSSPKLNFLEEIKFKARGEIEKGTQEDVLVQSSMSNGGGRNPNFLKEIRLKGEKQKEVQQGDGLSSNEAGFQESKQLEPTRTKIVQSSTKEKTATLYVNQGEEASKDFLDRRTLVEPLSSNTKKILRELENNEIRQKKLEKSLIQNGIRVNEDISYEEAKDKIAEISDSMKTLAAAGMDSYTAEKEYFRLEEQLSKYTTALMLTDEYAEEHRRLEQDWEDSIEADNAVALSKLRSYMPVKIRHRTEEELVTVPSPNGKTLPKPIARKFKRTNILQLLRVDPDDIEKMHPSLLEGMRTTGLTLTERRALHQHFKHVVERWTEKRSDPSIEKKWQWYQNLRLKFKETLSAYMKCVDQFGPPGSHEYAKRGDPSGGGCRLLGNQCPIKADAAISYNDDYGYTKEAMYENSCSRSEQNKAPQRNSSMSKDKSSKATRSSEADIVQGFRDRLCLDDNETEVDKKLLRELFHSNKRTKSLEKQLTHAGLSLPKEDIPYDVAKTRIAELTQELNEVAVNMGNTTDAKLLAKLEFNFGKLSGELDKYNNALMLTKEWAQEQKDKERQWEIEVSPANYEALKKVRRHMPVNIRNLSESSLATDLTPNGKVLPKALARKFKRTNVLMILRTDPSVIEVMHPSSLEAMRTTGLTLTERRAIHEHLKDVAPKWKAMTTDKMCERKWMWHASLQNKLKEMIGDQRSMKSDLATDYSGDYGYPENGEYEQQAVAKSNLLSMEELEKRRLEDEYS